LLWAEILALAQTKELGMTQMSTGHAAIIVALIWFPMPFGRLTTDFRCGPGLTGSRPRYAQFAARIRNTRKAKLGLSAGLHQVSALGVRRFFRSKFLPEPAAVGLDDPAPMRLTIPARFTAHGAV